MLYLPVPAGVFDIMYCMSIDSTKRMVLIDSKIATGDLVYCVLDKGSDWYAVKYKGSDKYYRFATRRVTILENPIKMQTEELSALGEDLGYHIGAGYRFEAAGKVYCHLVLANGEQLDIEDSDSHSRKIFTYLGKLADKISNDQNMLALLYKKLSYRDAEGSSLKYYLQAASPVAKPDDDTPIIFPFGCNLSQYGAVRNAIYNNFSIIEGPPGTGKTQTILNILANLIIRKQSCQVVSNNNSAVENIEEKLEKYGLDFVAAKLGSKSSRAKFIENQKAIPDLHGWARDDDDTMQTKLRELSREVLDLYAEEQKLSKVNGELSEIKIEHKHFKRRMKSEGTNIRHVTRHGDAMGIWQDIQERDRLSFWCKLKYILIYHIGDFELYKNGTQDIIATIQNEIYQQKIGELAEKADVLTKRVSRRAEIKNTLEQTSLTFFKSFLAKKYAGFERPHYEPDTMYRHFNYFSADYPVVLSTTYSARSSFSANAKFDYVVMDEASQIDITTGALALSSGKNAVIVGDEKQLPNVVPEKEKEITDAVFKQYGIDPAYSFSQNSFLSSAKQILPDVPKCLLREHYRCQSKIINFCNQEFYNSQLIVMSKDLGQADTIKVIRTNAGNHARGHINQRQIDIIKDLLAKLSSRDVGIIAPYRDQVAEIRRNVPDYIEVDTIHKFQGREKDIIIISTVDNEISDFVDDPHILNVAISRAKKQLIMITTGNEIKNTYINHFIDYANYYNFEVETSPIYSIFDFLYSQYTKERLRYLARLPAVSDYDSENLMHRLIKDELASRGNLGVVAHQPLNILIRDYTLLTPEERKYAKNYLTHLDFVIYDKITKRPILAIEVDGYKYHRDGTKQHERDLMKDLILEKYDIPSLRFSTTGSREKEKLTSKLDQILGR